MWNTFKYTVLYLIREKNVLIWAFAFPLILATLFNFMFANLDEAFDLKPIPTALVSDASYEDATAFSEMIEQVSEPGENQLLDIHFASSDAEAKEKLEQGTVEGIIRVDSEGIPSYSIGAKAASSESTLNINRTIVKNLLDSYIHNRSALTSIIESNPELLADPEFMNTLTERGSYTQEITVTANDPSGSVRYFYALLGFSAVMAATIALTAISLSQPNTSPLGARRDVGATPRLVTLMATLMASWLLSFCSLMIGFLYIRYVLGIDFGGREAACILALLVSSLVSTSLGSLIGAIPKLSEGIKAGIMTGLSCTLALFAGLYGTASQELADDLSRVAPGIQLFNPAKQISDAFYSLYYYDTYAQFQEVLVILLVTAGVFFAGAALLMRRQRYASL